MATIPADTALVRQEPTPLDLLQIAVTQGADIDKLQKLMELQERWERNQARKAFVEAMNAFKKNPPTITKNKHVKFGQTEYNHATLDHVCDVITKSLSEHGISHRWTVNQDTAQISVTCILTHEMGHSEETRLVGEADKSGSKNSIQAVGSTVTYLQRYTLLAATGLAAGGDSDGMSNGDLAEQLEWIANCRDMKELNSTFKSALDEAKKARASKAMLTLVEAYDERKADLQ